MCFVCWFVCVGWVNSWLDSWVWWVCLSDSVLCGLVNLVLVVWLLKFFSCGLEIMLCWDMVGMYRCLVLGLWFGLLYMCWLVLWMMVRRRWRMFVMYLCSWLWMVWGLYCLVICGCWCCWVLIDVGVWLVWLCCLIMKMVWVLCFRCGWFVVFWWLCLGEILVLCCCCLVW